MPHESCVRIEPRRHDLAEDETELETSIGGSVAAPKATRDDGRKRRTSIIQEFISL